jgi:hypothetical protein
MLIVIAILSLLAAYFRREYFFNPLTFHNDSVINLPYKYYRNPLYIEYDYVKPSTNGSLVPTYYRSVTTSRTEILQVITDLRNTSVSSVTPDHNMLGNAGMTYIFLRQQVFSTPRPPSPILLTVQIYRAQHVMEIIQTNGAPPVLRSLPQSLETLLKTEEAKSQPDR